MPQILDELAVSLTVEAGRFNQGMSQADKTIENMRRRFAAVQGTIDRATQRMDAFERETNQVRTATDRASRSFSSQRDAVNTLGRRILGLAAAYIGFRQAVQFIRSSTEAFFEQTRATNELAVALQSAGITGATALAQLERGASNIQTQFNLSDEAITRATARISAFAPALKVSDLERAQRAVAGLSHIMGDTDTAANAVAKALAGQATALTRYGIAVTNTGTAQDRLNQIIASPAVQTALAQLATNAKTVEGRVRAAGIAWDEFKETLGGVIVDMATAGEKADSLADSLNNMRESIERNRLEWVQTGRILVAVFTAIPRTILNVVSIAVTGQIHMFEVLRRELSTTMAAIQAIPRGPGAVLRVIALGQQKVFDETRARAIEAIGDLKDIEEAWKGVAAAANAPIGGIGKGKGGSTGGGLGIDPEDVETAVAQADRIAEAFRSIVAEEAGFRALRDAVAGTSIEFDPLSQRAGMLAGQMNRLTALMGEFPSRAGEIAPVLAAVVSELNSLTLEMDANAAAAQRQAEWLARIPEIMRDTEDATRDALELQRQYAEIDWRPAMDKAKRELDRMEETAQSIGSAFEGALVSIVSATDSIADAIKRMVQSIIADLARLTLQRTIIEPIVGAIEGALKGGVEIPGIPVRGPDPPLPSGAFAPASTGRFSPAMATPAAAPMHIHQHNTFEVRSIDTREGAQFLQQHAPAIGQLAAREFQKSAGLQSLVRGRR